MPGFYPDGEYDLAGFIVGVVDRDRIITGKDVQIGDIILGMASNGLHTNGYSLARKLLFEVARYSPETYVNEIKNKVGNELMRTHKSYWPALKKLIDAQCVAALAHITGGGITENLPRVLPRGTAAVIELGTWPVPPIFEHLQQLGNVPQEEMLRTFNMGIGMLLVVPSAKFKKAQSVLERVGEKAYTIGRIVKGERKVTIAKLIEPNDHVPRSLGILLSGRGSNFVAIADSIDAGRIPDARIAVVISNRADAPGIATARQRGLNALVIPSKGKPRDEHDREVVFALKEHKVDLICLAGYMRLLSPWFVQQFPRQILNIHPSLLPAFPASRRRSRPLPMA